MAEDNSEDLMGYEAMAQEALRGVVKAALRRATTPEGLPGAHHLYITFKTRAAGVSVPPDLAERYPEEMTIVLQHQFYDLAPGETFFAITLRFGGQPKRLSVPYAAITRFYDPSVQFLLQFEAEDAPIAALEAPASEVVPIRPRPEAVPDRLPAPAAAPDSVQDGGHDGRQDGLGPDDGPPDPEDGPKIVSLDKFRKK